MIPHLSPIADSLRGHDIGDAMDSLWANAALPRVTGLVGKPEPEVVSALSGDHPISQEEAAGD